MKYCATAERHVTSSLRILRNITFFRIISPTLGRQAADLEFTCEKVKSKGTMEKKKKRKIICYYYYMNKTCLVITSNVNNLRIVLQLICFLV